MGRLGGLRSWEFVQSVAPSFIFFPEPFLADPFARIEELSLGKRS